jgi:hypothetical protein
MAKSVSDRPTAKIATAVTLPGANSIHVVHGFSAVINEDPEPVDGETEQDQTEQDQSDQSDQ